MAEARVLRFAEVPTVDRGNGIVATPLVTGALGSEHLSSGITSFEPGSGVALHSHNCDEIVCVIEGEAVCEVAGQTHVLRAYGTTFAPAGVPHRFSNRSDRPMKILWTYASAHVTRTFVETGQTVQHMSAGDRASLARETRD